VAGVDGAGAAVAAGFGAAVAGVVDGGCWNWRQKSPDGWEDCEKAGAATQQIMAVVTTRRRHARDREARIEGTWRIRGG
jgi:hypothetical protein